MLVGCIVLYAGAALLAQCAPNLQTSEQVVLDVANENPCQWNSEELQHARHVGIRIDLVKTTACLDYVTEMLAEGEFRRSHLTAGYLRDNARTGEEKRVQMQLLKSFNTPEWTALEVMCPRAVSVDLLIESITSFSNAKFAEELIVSFISLDHVVRCGRVFEDLSKLNVKRVRIQTRVQEYVLSKIRLSPTVTEIVFDGELATMHEDVFLDFIKRHSAPLNSLVLIPGSFGSYPFLDNIVKVLPASLQILKIDAEHFTMPSLSSLTGLKHLHVYSRVYDASGIEDLINTIPSNIETLSMDTVLLDTQYYLLSEKLKELTKLKSFRVRLPNERQVDDYTVIFKNLPNDLQELEIGNPFSPMNKIYDYSRFTQLKSLSVNARDATTEVLSLLMSTLPQTLETLNIFISDKALDVRDIKVKSLPKGLLNLGLELGSEFYLKEENLAMFRALLPSTVVSFKTKGLFEGSISTRPFIQALQSMSGLKHFQVDTWFSRVSTEEQIKMLKAIPPTVETLSFDNSIFDIDLILKELGSNVKYLEWFGPQPIARDLYQLCEDSNRQCFKSKKSKFSQ